jgi:hypothetical protein
MIKVSSYVMSRVSLLKGETFSFAGEAEVHWMEYVSMLDGSAFKFPSAEMKEGKLIISFSFNRFNRGDGYDEISGADMDLQSIMDHFASSK